MISEAPKWTYREYVEKRLNELLEDIIKQVNLGRSYLLGDKKYNPDMAIEIFKKIVEEYPWYEEGRYWLGYTHYNKAIVSLFESIKEYEEAIKINSDNYFAYRDLAFSYKMLDEIEEAITQLEEAIKAAKRVSANTEDTEEKKTIREFISESEAKLAKLKKILTIQPKEQLQSEH